MAEKKLTLAALRKMLAKQTGIPEAKTGAFLDAFFPTIVEGLIEDGQVRLNGLGTFKVQTVQPRKSVNVKTGESIIIDGYNKVVFTAENEIREQANAEFSHLSAVKIPAKTTSVTNDSDIDPIKKLGEQADEIKDILAQLGAVLPEPTESEGTDEDTTIVIDSIEQEEATVIETELVIEQTSDSETIPEPAADTNVEINNEINAENKSDNEDNTVVTVTPQPFHPWKVAGITILIFCMILVGLYFFLKHKIISWADSLIDNNKFENVVDNKETDLSDDLSTTTPLITENENDDDSSQSVDTAKVVLQEPVTDQWFSDNRVYTDFIKTETLTDGSRLTHLARKYYGSPDFWVYIYEANKDKIHNPNKIGVGTKIRIPRLPDQLIDINSPQALHQAKELHNKILENR